jgi:allophanate hydrolase
VISFDLQNLAAGYASAAFTPVEIAREALQRMAAAGNDHVWICRVPEHDVLLRAAELEALPASARARLPLYGVPFAVKDNIDVAGLPTTAACPQFSYVAQQTAPVVGVLLAAGAILIGKTNLDQFATGLVGVRSPYGVPRNPFKADYIPGGSSSGSAVAVAAGLVSFALGTDTAGSGRVPAGFNNIVGLKPTRGLLSARGVVPACRTLDCVSIFALTVADAAAILKVAAAYDADDAYARMQGREAALSVARRPATFRFAVPRAADRVFFGDDAYREIFERGIARLEALGGTAIEVDYAPFRETAALLYDGPFVAERVAAVRAFHERQADAFHPATRAIYANAARFNATDTFQALYRLEELRARTRALWRDADVMLVPTSGTIYTVAQIAADPLKLNANLGAYTNFVNFLDLAAIAIPSAITGAGLPCGATLIAPACQEPLLLALGDEFHRAANLPMGATGVALPARPLATAAQSDDGIDLLVVGGHMTGLPLNRELTSIGARFVRAARTAPLYRFYALPGGPPRRPGMVRVRAGEGMDVEGEIWRVPASALGRFLTGIPAPLGLGRVTLADDTSVVGFLCEACAVADATDISEFGGWRAFLREALPA